MLSNRFLLHTRRYMNGYVNGITKIFEIFLHLYSPGDYTYLYLPRYKKIEKLREKGLTYERTIKKK